MRTADCFVFWKKTFTQIDMETSPISSCDELLTDDEKRRSKHVRPQGVASGSKTLAPNLGIDFMKFPALMPKENGNGLNETNVTLTSKPLPLSAIRAAVPPETTDRPTAKASTSSPNLRKYASLSTFVEGNSNKLARTAAEYVLKGTEGMNPLYIYGQTSVGKTHLLEGIYSEARKNKRSKPPMYMTAEQFTSSFVECVRPGGSGTPGLRNKFRGISMLLIDDIPFLAKKTATQAELLQIIDALKNEGVQLVFTGDRPLKELVGLRSELISRLESGMVCGIGSAERETLLAIFVQMVQQRNLSIPDEVCRFVVSRLNIHARQLSGALNRLHASILADGKPITLEVVERILDDLIRNNRKAVRLPDVEKAVCELFGIVDNSLQTKSRSKHVSHPRMIAMWLARKYTRSALSEIGKYFGNRTHSTVVSAQKKVDKWIEENTELMCFDQSCTVVDIIQKLERNLQTGSSTQIG